MMGLSQKKEIGTVLNFRLVPFAPQGGLEKISGICGQWNGIIKTSQIKSLI
jgi:hypothetical protein